MTSQSQELSTAELIKLLDDPHYLMVDTRPIDAFNGWKLKGEKRGGHIRNAKSFPAKWAEYIDWIEIARGKGLSGEKNLVLYGYDDDEVYQVEKQFRKAGIGPIFIYPHFLDEWVVDLNCPVDHMPRFDKLVPPQWLYSKLFLEEENISGKLVVCHAHYQNKNDYKKGHIPGAIALDTNELESQKTWNRKSPGELREVLERHGITSDSTVVMYGRFSFPSSEDPYPGSSAGHLGAIRAAVILMYAGVKDVRVLNGGIQSWEDENYAVSKKVTIPDPVADFGEEIPANPEVFIDLPQAKVYLQEQDAKLVSVRSWPEIIGEVSGYHYIAKKGRIPGAVFGNGGSDAYHMENYRNLDHTTREYYEIAYEWIEKGITPDKKLAFYCGTGWRGAEAFFNAYLMGWPDIAVYDGGWFEWSNDPANPIGRGMPEEEELFF